MIPPSVRTSVTARLRNSRFLRHSSLLLGANFLTSALSLGRTVATTWLIPKSQIGMLGVLFAWLPFLQLLSMPGVNAASYHYVAKGDKWAFPASINFRIKWALLTSAGFTIVGFYYWQWQKSPTIAWLFLVAALTYPMTYGLSGLPNIFAALENFRALFWYRLVDSFSYFAGFLPLLLLYLGDDRVVGYFATNQLVRSVFQISICIWLLRLLGGWLRKAPSPQDQRGMLSYARQMTTVNAVSTFQGRADGLIVSVFLSLQTMADYSIAQLVHDQFKQLWQVYHSVRYPPWVRLSSSQRWRQFIREGAIFLILYSGAGVVLSLAAHFLVPVIFPPAYSTSLPLINVMLVVLVIGVPGGMVETYFRTEQDHQIQISMRTFAAIAGLIAPLLLVQIWGVYGVLIGRGIANLLFSIYGAILFVRHRPA